MNTFNRKNLAASLIIAASTMLSISASAEQISLEQLLTHKVQAQGQEVSRDLNLQVKQSIEESLQAFSTNESQQWLSGRDSQIASVNHKKESSNFTFKSATE